jgi:hypothetical protein
MGRSATYGKLGDEQVHEPEPRWGRQRRVGQRATFQTHALVDIWLMKWLADSMLASLPKLVMLAVRRPRIRAMSGIAVGWSNRWLRGARGSRMVRITHLLPSPGRRRHLPLGPCGRVVN